MRVYHFIKAKYGLNGISNRRLKISNLLNLNDPFELLAMELSDGNFREAVNSAKLDTAKDFGVVCFSKNWKSPVQWAHYGDRHRGLCLGFDVPRKCMEKVDYVPNRLKHQGTLDENAVMTLLRTKHEHWQYEEEYRAFVPLEEEIDGAYYTTFSATLELKEVIVGSNSPVTRQQLNNAVGSASDVVSMFKARPAFKRFEMTKQNKDSLWT